MTTPRFLGFFFRITFGDGVPQCACERSGDSVMESALSFHLYLRPRDGTWVAIP